MTITEQLRAIYETWETVEDRDDDAAKATLDAIDNLSFDLYTTPNKVTVHSKALADILCAFAEELHRP